MPRSGGSRSPSLAGPAPDPRSGPAPALPAATEPLDTPGTSGTDSSSDDYADLLSSAVSAYMTAGTTTDKDASCARISAGQAPGERGPDERGPDKRGPDKRGPDKRGPDKRGPDKRGPGKRTAGAAMMADQAALQDDIRELEQLAKGMSCDPDLAEMPADLDPELLQMLQMLHGDFAAGAGRPGDGPPTEADGSEPELISMFVRLMTSMMPMDTASRPGTIMAEVHAKYLGAHPDLPDGLRTRIQQHLACYVEISKLEGEPAEVQQRITELLARLDGLEALPKAVADTLQQEVSRRYMEDIMTTPF